ncbi:hypothetical protein [Candidatus Nitrotoga sp. AM1P]|uniref:hypothetical protein n=1 Tax=Candidatus Nitrotoga sp. AM1P TaxID=2559597 RepID=UPI001564B06D|nr:hypothetical protein [Candidatus Nitrotoga sp. AM1P]
MNINKTELQVQIDENSAHASDFAIALNFVETYKLQSGAIDWTQASALPVG